MTLTTPSFWYREENSETPAMEKILSPLSLLYGAGRFVHKHAVQPKKCGVPVICIGNINAGGSGKTPAALAVMELIKTHRLAQYPFFLSRGYGGSEKGPLLVEPGKHSAWDTGDEALLLAEKAPTVISADRFRGAAFAAENKADLIVMDDGLQNPGLRKDIKIVVIDGAMGFGNGRLLPAGPLREPLSSLQDADAFILIGKDKRNAAALLPEGKRVFRVSIAASPPAKGTRWFAFAGIGFPEKFFSFLKNDLQTDIAETAAFPDHYPYGEKDIRILAEKAARANARLITTRKDFLRVPPVLGIEIDVLDTKLAWTDETAVLSFLKARLEGAVT